ncbi:hypothetical protein NESM_000348400 [Novymonas esmeraldas]|uniref:Uncharacterized protein n=1 Tax=Novymonas esmeraldas TaxID=1808958 RepID=A0AAW0ELN0_9TRYP
MFDPKQITAAALQYAPQFVLSRFASVVMGVIVAYGVLLFFLGHPPFFQRVAELALMMSVGYGGARGARRGIARLVYLIDGTAPETGTAATSAESRGAIASPTSPNAATATREMKGLD